MTNKDFEILSAYLDDELSPSERTDFETELALSAELRNRLDEMKKIKKLTNQSFKQLNESPYLETRIMVAISERKHWYSGLKRFVPVVGFASLAIVIMVFLKFNPDVIEELVEKQKTNLAGFYTENLKPLLFAADLSNEDIFNFAFYKQLPLDNDNKQFLHLGSDADGSEFFEIKTASFVSDENNFEKFVRVLNLDEKQREKMDSILEAYALELQSQVLVNDKNTVAINPNLWNYNKAIVAELLAFASTANKSEFNRVVPAGFSIPNVANVERVIEKIKLNKDNNYIFFTPDTIFSEPLNIDEESIYVELQRMKEIQKQNFVEAQKQLKESMVLLRLDSNLAKLKHEKFNKNFRVMIDTNICRIHIPDGESIVIELPDFDSITAHIDKVTRDIDAFAFSIPKTRKGSSDYKFRFELKDSIGRIGIPLPNIDSLVQLEKLFADSVAKFNLKNFNFNPDSIASLFQFWTNDSLAKFQSKEFDQQMKKFQKEMEIFRKEMEEMKKNIQKEKIEVKKEEPIEI
ncbi:MAG: hypothetical protein IPM56_03975 [Ignavibacteriales bacterium]|nr:MAG: hypothetical protein IPM56_03975 [Ignavibacteriales bacterium]